MLDYLGVSTIHCPLTWTTGSLTCVCDLFACVYTRGTSVYSFIRRTFVGSAQFDPGEIAERVQSLACNRYASIWWPRFIMAFRRPRFNTSASQHQGRGGGGREGLNFCIRCIPSSDRTNGKGLGEWERGGGGGQGKEKMCVASGVH